jgi:hypothetical protein
MFFHFSKKIGIFITAFFLFFSLKTFGQTRSFGDVYPNLAENQKAAVFSDNGLVFSEKTSVLRILPSGAGLNIASPIPKGKATYITESLAVIPYTGKKISVLDIYNAMQNIRGLKGRLYHSATKNADIPLFEDATRIVSEKNTSAIADPPSASSLPSMETFFVRLKDANFGNTYYRVEAASNNRALICTLTNFKNFTYLLVPVIKEEKFIAQLYIEPVNEGVLMYSVASADVGDFFASKIDVPSAIQKRLAVIEQWMIDGIKK